MAAKFCNLPSSNDTSYSPSEGGIKFTEQTARILRVFWEVYILKPSIIYYIYYVFCESVALTNFLAIHLMVIILQKLYKISFFFFVDVTCILISYFILSFPLIS